MIIPKSPPPICGNFTLVYVPSIHHFAGRIQSGINPARQCRLAERASELGWQHHEQIKVLDQDLGISGSGLAERAGFTHMTAEVWRSARFSIMLGLEVSRLARNNADWYQLLDLCGTTDTLIGDADGIYHPGMFNDRLVLGLKGTIKEPELHVLRARLNGGIRNKAARGELRRGLPVGLIWGGAEADGCCFTRRSGQRRDWGGVPSVSPRWAPHARCGYGFSSAGTALPVAGRAHCRKCAGLPELCEDPSRCSAIRVYAGAYVYGKSRQERYMGVTRTTFAIDVSARIDWIAEHPMDLRTITHSGNVYRQRKAQSPTETIATPGVQSRAANAS